MYEHVIEIDREAAESLQMQIRRQLAIGILNRHFPLGQPLPSVRRLAADLHVSAITVAQAYASLQRDGFVVARARIGYFVNPDGLSDLGYAAATAGRAAALPPPAERIDYAAFFEARTFRHRHVVKPADCLVRYRYPFVCGLNDPALFPLRQWRECVHDSVTAVDLSTLASDYSAIDDELLIEQLTQRVLVKRGITAGADEVLVTLGGQQALYLAIKLLLTQGQTLGVEDPGYPDVVNMARIEGVQVQRLPVDEQGLVLVDAVRRCHCLFVTPSHHFPTTVTMTRERRRALLALTAAHGQFVIEDDYEAELSFNKTPPAALKSLDRRGNVIYAAGLSKSLLQGLRVGYLVADREFIREARALRHHMLRHPPVNNQRSVALFLQRGYFDRYIATLTAIYKKRCDVMHEALERHFPGGAVKPEYGGASMWLTLPERVDTGLLLERAAPKGVYFETGGFTFADERHNRHHLRLGYSVIKRARIGEGIGKIAEAVPHAIPQSGAGLPTG